MPCGLRLRDGDCPCCLTTLQNREVVEPKCGHPIHADCFKKQLDSRWHTRHISFAFLNCMVCRQRLSGEDLEPFRTIVDPLLSLEKKIKKRSVELYLTEERYFFPAHQPRRSESPDLSMHVAPSEAIKQQHEDYVLGRYRWNLCTRCKIEPVCAGLKVCDADDAENDDGSSSKRPSRILQNVCKSCRPSSSNASDRKLGKQCRHEDRFKTFKCRFCCKVAEFECFGPCRMCSECQTQPLTSFLQNAGSNKLPLHKYPQCDSIRSQIKSLRTNKRYKKMSRNEKMQAYCSILSDPSTCPLRVAHPPNGIEFPIKCLLCNRDRKQVAVRKPIDVDRRAEQMSDGVSNIVDTVGCGVDEKSPTKETEQIGGSLQKVISCHEEIIRTEPSNKRTENAACATRKTCCIA